MRVPAFKIISIGETTAWGKQFLSALQQNDIIDISYEPNLDRFTQSLAPLVEPPILFLENSPESRKWITELTKSSRPAFVVWFGRMFTKEDYVFALDQRIYTIFENLKSDDRRVLQQLQKLAQNRDTHSRFEHLIRAMKSILIQAESEEEARPLVNEMRVAVSKLEKCNLQNEFLHATPEVSAGGEERLPFHRSQNFADTLLTVEDLERTGTLWVKGMLPAQEGKIEFLQGKLVSAHAGEVHGQKALYRMFLWDTPRYLFMRKNPGETTPQEAMDISLKYLCREGLIQRGKYDLIRRELPPAEITLTLEPNALHVDTSLEPIDFSTLASVVEFGRISNVLDYSSVPDVYLYESLIRLKKNKLIQIAA